MPLRRPAGASQAPAKSRERKAMLRQEIEDGGALLMSDHENTEEGLGDEGTGLGGVRLRHVASREQVTGHLEVMMTSLNRVTGMKKLDLAVS